MSHVTTIATEIRDLEALKSACQELGVEFLQDQRTYKWYGASVGDYPVPEGITPEELGKCAHAIRVPGVEYEVGVVSQPSGRFILAYDFWGPGQGLLEKFGEGCGRLLQLYGVHKATRQAQRRGLTVLRRTQQDGTIKLTIGGM